MPHRHLEFDSYPNLLRCVCPSKDQSLWYHSRPKISALLDWLFMCPYLSYNVSPTFFDPLFFEKHSSKNPLNCYLSSVLILHFNHCQPLRIFYFCLIICGEKAHCSLVIFFTCTFLTSYFMGLSLSSLLYRFGTNYFTFKKSLHMGRLPFRASKLISCLLQHMHTWNTWPMWIYALSSQVSEC